MRHSHALNEPRRHGNTENIDHDISVPPCLRGFVDERFGVSFHQLMSIDATFLATEIAAAYAQRRRIISVPDLTLRLHQ